MDYSKRVREIKGRLAQTAVMLKRPQPNMTRAEIKAERAALEAELKQMQDASQ